MSDRCTATTEAGTRCQIQSQVIEGLCIWHDPDRKAEADALRKKGQAGRTPSRRSEVRTVDPKDTPGALETLDDLVEWASWVARAVVTGLIDARTARECSYALTTFRGGIEKRDLSKELARLRDDFAAFKKRRDLKTA